MRTVTPRLDPRNAERVFMELMRRRSAYLPAWAPKEGQPGWALLHIFSRYMQTVIERLNKAPEKNLLAFLDMLGIHLIPAQAARAPVVFTPMPSFGNGRVAARTRVGAKIPGKSEPLVFETETAIALATARLAEVKTLWPARDEYADHTSDQAGGRPFTLFGDRRPVPHELYIAHDTLLAFAGKSTVEIEFELSTPGSEPLAITWEYWDGQIWRSFRAFDPTDETSSRDGTDGLTHSGIVTLRAECGKSAKTKVNGVEAYWVRGCLSKPLPPNPARVLAEIDRLRLRSFIERPFGKWDAIENEVSGEIRLEGVVKDAEGIPLEGLRVELSALTLGQLEFFEPQATDLDGAFAFTGSAIEPGARFRLKVSGALIPDFARTILVGDAAIRLELYLTKGLALDLAFSDGLEIDLSKPFLPLSLFPQLGSAFYFFNEEIFSKAGAFVTGVLDCGLQRSQRAGEVPLEVAPEVEWEYWHGAKWAPLPILPKENSDQNSSDDENPLLFTGPGKFSFMVPTDMAAVDVQGKKNLWMRAVLKRGAYGFQQTLSFGEIGGLVFGEEPPPVSSITTVNTVPPVIHLMQFGFSYRSAWERPEHCITYNDFQYELHTSDARWPGGFFPPFRPVADTTPALYLGFDQPLPNDLVSFYVDVEEQEASTPLLIWEAWNGKTWEVVRPTDETVDLQRPGMVSFIAPEVDERPQVIITGADGSEITAEDALKAAVFKAGEPLVVEQGKDRAMGTVLRVQGERILLESPLAGVYTGGTVSLAPLPRFGKALDWLRGRLKEDGAPAKSEVNGIYLNASWASQVRTIENEVLGSGTGQVNQALFFTQVPVLPGERIEVRELDGARAEVELPILREELFKQGLNEEDIRLERDPRSGRIAKVWVRWQYRPHLYFSSPNDRHYTLERSSGRLQFGGKGGGRIPTVGPNNIQARIYRAGGGVAGNVPARRINQLLGAAPLVQEVTNPRAAEGGADGEQIDSVRSRGPQTIRHQLRALSAQDFEALAREASPGIASVRALPMTAPNLRPASGWVTLIIVPQSEEARPQPSFELRRQVHDYLALRVPATLDPGRIGVIGPTYLPVGVTAIVVPRVIAEAGVVESRARNALETFLHPLHGGPDGGGWPFGRDIFLSDLAAVLESIEGVDYVRELNLLLNDTPRGERLAVPPDRIVVAGTLRIEMQAGEPVPV